MLDEFISISSKTRVELEDYYTRHLEKIGNDLKKFLEKS